MTSKEPSTFTGTLKAIQAQGSIKKGEMVSLGEDGVGAFTGVSVPLTSNSGVSWTSSFTVTKSRSTESMGMRKVEPVYALRSPVTRSDYEDGSLNSTGTDYRIYSERLFILSEKEALKYAGNDNLIVLEPEETRSVTEVLDAQENTPKHVSYWDHKGRRRFPKLVSFWDGNKTSRTTIKEVIEFVKSQEGSPVVSDEIIDNTSYNPNLDKFLLSGNDKAVFRSDLKVPGFRIHSYEEWFKPTDNCIELLEAGIIQVEVSPYDDSDQALERLGLKDFQGANLDGYSKERHVLVYSPQDAKDVLKGLRASQKARIRAEKNKKKEEEDLSVKLTAGNFRDWIRKVFWELGKQYCNKVGTKNIVLSLETRKDTNTWSNLWEYYHDLVKLCKTTPKLALVQALSYCPECSVDKPKKSKSYTNWTCTLRTIDEFVELWKKEDQAILAGRIHFRDHDNRSHTEEVTVSRFLEGLLYLRKKTQERVDQGQKKYDELSKEDKQHIKNKTKVRRGYYDVPKVKDPRVRKESLDFLELTIKACRHKLKLIKQAEKEKDLHPLPITQSSPISPIREKVK